MPAIYKNGKQYAGIPDEVVTAWEVDDTIDLEEIDQAPLGTTDISDIGDGSLTGAISELNSDISGVDLSDGISVYNSRAIIYEKYCYRYPTGRTEFYIRAKFNATLTTSQKTVFVLSNTILTDTCRLSGTANIDTLGAAMVYAQGFSGGIGISIDHNGITTNPNFSLYACWYN